MPTQSQSVHIHIGSAKPAKKKKRSKPRSKPMSVPFATGGGGGAAPPQGTLFPIRETIREAPLALPAPPLAPMTLNLGYPPVQGNHPPHTGIITIADANTGLHTPRHQTVVPPATYTQTRVPSNSRSSSPDALATQFASLNLFDSPPIGGNNAARRESILPDEPRQFTRAGRGTNHTDPETTFLYE